MLSSGVCALGHLGILPCVVGRDTVSRHCHSASCRSGSWACPFRATGGPRGGCRGRGSRNRFGRAPGRRRHHQGNENRNEHPPAHRRPLRAALHPCLHNPISSDSLFVMAHARHTVVCRRPSQAARIPRQTCIGIRASERPPSRPAAIDRRGPGPATVGAGIPYRGNRPGP